jgi:hypothetical protein
MLELIRLVPGPTRIDLTDHSDWSNGLHHVYERAA